MKLLHWLNKKLEIRFKNHFEVPKSSNLSSQSQNMNQVNSLGGKRPGKTPLALAVHHNALDVCQVLFNAKADVHFRDEHNFGLIDLARQNANASDTLQWYFFSHYGWFSHNL